jgi:2'-5' RNA ligase
MALVKEQEAISLNIAILPDAYRKEKAIGLSRRVTSEVPSYFTLDGENLHPHFTVYQAHYPLKNLEKLKEAVHEIAGRLRGLEMTMDSFRISHETFVFWACEKTDELVRAQTETIRIVNALREELIMPQLKDRGNLSEGDKEDIQNYGSLLIGPRYDPHITITRIRNPEDGNRVLGVLGEANRETFKPDSLVLAHLGEHGTLTKIVERVSL